MQDVLYALSYRTWADGLKVGYAFSAERIAVQLRDDPSIRSLLLADPYRSWLSKLRRRPPAPPFSTDPTRRLIQPHRWSRQEPMSIEAAAPVYRQLDHWLHGRTAGRETTLVTSHPVLAAVAEQSRWRDIAYYAWDDFRGIPGARDLVQSCYDQVASRSVNVVAVAPAIAEAIGSDRSTIVPNGIVASDYNHLPAPPDWFTAINGRIAFYAGSLEGRIDVPAVVQLARDLGDDWSIVMVGPLQDRQALTPLLREPRIHVRDVEPRDRVLSMMAASDVCLVPHRPETESMSPLKVYEYLGAGSPVVATDLGPMRGLSPRCLLTPSGRPLVDAVLKAAELGPAPAWEIAAFREANDWSARYQVWRRAVLGY